MGGPSICAASAPPKNQDRKSTRLNSSHTEIYTLSLHDALPISGDGARPARRSDADGLGLTDHGRAEYLRGLGAAKESRALARRREHLDAGGVVAQQADQGGHVLGRTLVLGEAL